MLQEAPHDTPSPDGFAGARHRPCLGQAAPDLAKRQAVATAPGQDLADHAPCVRQARIAGLPAPRICGHRAGARGRAAPHMPAPDVCRMTLPTPVACDALGALIRRAHAWHWQAQSIFGALAQRAVQEEHLPRGPAARLDQQALVGILPGQTIGRMDLEAVHPAGGHDSAPAPDGPAWRRSPLPPDTAWPPRR